MSSKIKTALKKIFGRKKELEERRDQVYSGISSISRKI
jgi:hypothetical protein